MERMDARSARLRGFLASDPTNATLAGDLAEALIAEGAPEEAAQVLASLPETAARTARVRFLQARIALITGSYADAERIYRDLIAAGDESAAVWHDLAFSQLCQRQADAAAQSLQTAIARFNPDPALHVLQARTALMQSDYTAALAALERALALDPDDAAAQG